MRRAGRRTDEEQLLGMRGLKQFLAFGFLGAFDGGMFAEVDAGTHSALVEWGCCAFEILSCFHGVVNGVEGADNAPEAGEWRERVEGCDGGELLADGGQTGRLEDEEVVELGDDEGVAGRAGPGESR